ncbi:MAG: type II secretion system minor pseudopilin GspI [Gammaproteobacteria bacterium]
MNRPRQGVDRDRAFTLLEVLIALAIVGIGLLALLGTSIENTRVASGLRDRTFASYVAANEIETLQLAPNWPSLGKSEGHSRMAGTRWYWTFKVTHTASPGLLKVVVAVGLHPHASRALVSLTGFLGRSLLNRPSPSISAPPPPGVLPNPGGPLAPPGFGMGP